MTRAGVDVSVVRHVEFRVPELWGLLAVSVGMTLIPGIDTAMVLRVTLRGGRRDGLLTAAGCAAGLFVHASAVAVGLAALVATSAAAYEALRLAGAVFLIVLGVATLLGAARPSPALRTPRLALAERPFALGLVTNLSNPKALLFFLSVLPQFLPDWRPARCRPRWRSPSCRSPAARRHCGPSCRAACANCSSARARNACRSGSWARCSSRSASRWRPTAERGVEWGRPSSRPLFDVPVDPRGSHSRAGLAPAGYRKPVRAYGPCSGVAAAALLRRGKVSSGPDRDNPPDGVTGVVFIFKPKKGQIGRLFDLEDVR